MPEYRGYETAGRIFNDHFRRSKNSILKIGVLHNYIDEDSGDSWKAWEAGDYEASKQLMRTEERYQRWVALCKESPAIVTRIQITEDPSAPYEAWQIALFREYQALGAETLFLVRAQRLGSGAIPFSDVVIFDNSRILQWRYRPGSAGEVNGCLALDAANGDDISCFLGLRDEVIDAIEEDDAVTRLHLKLMQEK